MDDCQPENMFSSDSEIFETVLIWSVCIVVVMILAGIAVEGGRYYMQVNTGEKINNWLFVS